MQSAQHRESWNKGKLVGQESPLMQKYICAIRIYRQSAHQCRDLAMSNLAIDSKPRHSYNLSDAIGKLYESVHTFPLLSCL